MTKDTDKRKRSTDSKPKLKSVKNTKNTSKSISTLNSTKKSSNKNLKKVVKSTDADSKISSSDSTKITKKDPKAEIKPWVEFSRDNKNKKKSRDKKANVGPSLANLKRERRRKTITKIAILLIVSLIGAMGLIYYLSPVSLTERIVVDGGEDIQTAEILDSANLKLNDHILGQVFRSKDIQKRLKYDYPSIKSVDVSMDGLTTLKIKIKQNQIMAYLQKGNVYQKVLTNGDISTETIVPKQLDGKPIFLGYKIDKKLKRDIKLIKKMPSFVKDNIKLVNTKNAKQNQIILVMKDQNVIIGDTDTINKKIKFYKSIKKQLSGPMVVDFEIGAFSRPITEADKKSYLQ